MDSSLNLRGGINLKKNDILNNRALFKLWFKLKYPDKYKGAKRDILVRDINIHLQEFLSEFNISDPQNVNGGQWATVGQYISDKDMILRKIVNSTLLNLRDDETNYFEESFKIPISESSINEQSPLSNIIDSSETKIVEIPLRNVVQQNPLSNILDLSGTIVNSVLRTATNLFLNSENSAVNQCLDKFNILRLSNNYISFPELQSNSNNFSLLTIDYICKMQSKFLTVFNDKYEALIISFTAKNKRAMSDLEKSVLKYGAFNDAFIQTLLSIARIHQSIVEEVSINARDINSIEKNRLKETFKESIKIFLDLPKQNLNTIADKALR